MNKEQKEALFEYQKASLVKSKESRIAKVIKIILIILAIYVLFVFICYKLGDYFYLPIPPGERHNKYYDIKLNEVNVSAKVFRNEKVPLIPYVFYWDRSQEFISHGSENKDVSKSGRYVLNIKAYSCFTKHGSKEVLTSCRDELFSKKQKEVEIKYTSMKIYKYNQKDYQNPKYCSNEECLVLYDTIYDGKVINDITSYIKEEGLYGIKIITYEKNVPITLKFGLNNFGDVIKVL